ncbi:carboxypeptidase regulatory-like domain-containing protein [Patescibacteria group bacterium]|nr:carboxypeptidase regulatory-like domain-containing protein [Patescibacteria group bacterium]
MLISKTKILSYFKSIALLLALVIFSCSNLVQAAQATPASDSLSSQKISTPANHTIKFRTPTGIDSPTDTININLSSFAFGAVGVGDIDISHGAVTGLENSDAHAAVAAAGVWGISVGGGSIVLTPPTNAVLGTVPANNYIVVTIGTNSTGGVNQLTNPAVAGSYTIQISGGFGDITTIGIGILDDDTVTVSATVPSSLQITSIDPASVLLNSGAFTLNVNGYGFVSTTVIRIDGADRATTYVSSTHVTANILASDITSVGNRQIAAFNSLPGVLSNSLPLNVYQSGGGSGSTTPLVISNVQAINITQTSARVIWDTNLQANSLVQYGLTNAYGDSVSNGSFVLSHGLDLTGLTPNTTYHFRVQSVDQIAQSAASSDYTFTTLSVSPLIISNVASINITDTSAAIVWDTNRSASSLVEYGTSPTLGGWNTIAGNVLNHNVPISGLQPGTLYYYRVISHDLLGESATSSIYTFTTNSDTTPPSNITLSATPGDAQNLLSWTHSTEPDFAGVKLMFRTDAFPTGPFDGSFLYDGLATNLTHTGLTNGVTYYYAAYAYDSNGNFASGALASATPVGVLVPPATTTPPIPPTTTTPPIPPTIPSTTTPPVVPVIPPIPPTIPGRTVTALYYGAAGTLLLQPNSAGVYGVLGGTSVLAVVPTTGLGATVSTVFITVNGYTYSLALNANGTSYEGTFVAPSNGLFYTDIKVSFADGLQAGVADPFEIKDPGLVVEAELGEENNPIPDATVTLYVYENGAWQIWNPSLYNQYNPIQSNNDGSFAFVVPNGQYYAVISKDGYTTERTQDFTVDQNVFGDKVPLLRYPEPIVVTSTFPFVQYLPDQIRFAVVSVKQSLREPELVTATKDYAIPALVVVSVLNTAAAITLFNILAYLQFLFTQPILLFGRLRKRKWGVIYNSLTKQPIEFAIVRLVHKESNLTVQSKVTDKQGRYTFTKVQKGNYRLEVLKPHYDFPTQYLADRADDIDFTEIYHGEIISLDEDGVIALNVPIDPLENAETPRRILFRRFLRIIQHVVAISGLVLSLAAFAISPSWLVGTIVLVQLGFYLLFRKLALPVKAKPWGVVLDAKTKKPVYQAIVRVFDKKYNKLLETQITDKQGRYGFFADNNVYYITIEKPGFDKYTSPDIDLASRKEAVIDLSAELSPSKK